MDYIKKIKEKLNKTGGVITSKELKNSNIPTIYLTRMVEKGELIRADRGIYIDSNGDYDEYYFFIIDVRLLFFLMYPLFIFRGLQT